MNKSVLVENVAKNTGMSKEATGKIVNNILSEMSNIIVEHGSLTIVGFGTFNVVERKEKKGRNPRTGEEMTIEATSSVKFKPGKDLKNSIVNKA